MTKPGWDWHTIEVNSAEIENDLQGNLKLQRTKIRLPKDPSYPLSAIIIFEQDIHLSNGMIFPRHKIIRGTYNNADSYSCGGIHYDIYIGIKDMVIKLPSDDLIINPLQTQKCFRCETHYLKQDFTHIEIGETYQAICKLCHQRTAAKIKAYNSSARKNGGKTLLNASQWLQKLLDSQGYCHYCKEFIGMRLLLIEHQTPLSLGGDNSIENVVPACNSCNSSKGSRDVATWQYHEKSHNLCKKIQEHLGLSKHEVTNLAITKLAAELGLVDEGEVQE